MAARYARALLAIAQDRNETGAVGRELAALAALCAASGDLREFFARPSLPPAAKQAAAAEISARAGLSKLGGDFFALLVAQGRFDHLSTIAETYEALLDAKLGRVRARLRTAVPLTADELEQLTANLVKALKVDQVILNEIVDPSILGGFVVENDAILIDGSLRGQLDAMRTRLSEAPMLRVSIPRRNDEIELAGAAAKGKP